MNALSDFAASARSMLEAVRPTAPDDDPIVVPGKADAPPTLVVRSLSGGEPRAYAPTPSGAARRLSPLDDARLPGASWLGDERLPDLLRERPERLGTMRVRAYRPGRRLVVSVERPGLPTLYLKLFTASGHRRAAHRLAGVGEPPPGFRPCLPQHSIPEAAALCFAAVPGRSLHDILRIEGDASLDRLLGALEAARRIRVRGDLPLVDLPQAREAALAMVQRAAALLPELEALHARLVEWRAEPIGERTWLHGDLHDKQVFLTADVVHVIDLDSTAAGDATFDAANLAEHLRLRGLQFGTPVLGALGDALAAELVGRFGTEPRTVEAWRAVVRGRLAGVYGLRPRWQDLARRMAREATEMLGRVS